MRKVQEEEIQKQPNDTSNKVEIHDDNIWYYKIQDIMQENNRLNLTFRYGSAILFPILALVFYSAITFLLGPGLPEYMLFYPAIMFVSLLGFKPGVLATFISMIIVRIWILTPPVDQFSITTFLGAILFIFLGILISTVTELYRRNQIKAAAYDKEQALRESLLEKEFLADIVQNSSQPFAIHYPNGDLGIHNKAFEQLTGYTTEELKNVNWDTTLTPSKWNDITGQKLEELKSTHIPVRYEKEYIRKDGSRVPIELLVHITSDKEDNPRYYYSFITDITQRNKDEEELKNTNEELTDTQNKLEKSIKKLEKSNEELEQFAYVASHDLQEPLRMIRSFTQLLEKRYRDKLDSDAKEYIGFIVDGTKRMKELIDDLLTFSRLNTAKREFELSDLNQVLNSVLLDLKPTIDEKNAHIIHDNLPVVNCDSSQIRQVFQNLIINALKFNETPPEIHILTDENKKEWKFRVKDNGIGIDPEHQKQIFDVFRRLHTREEYTGTGIGLSICKKIIERHNGKIWVESELGKGTTFYFNIPK